ncbi:hypothetical protein [Paraliobacillus sp. JSM ZJ581]|uniref:hypothetical protein n=1 Tax=Paraliobacillus sp. JSM ZJ581 TaxID=3342118 RepID=UPI0035A8A433
MNRIKTIVFILIVVIFLSVIGYPYLNNFISKDSNMAKKINVTKGEYVVGKDINQGLYDIEVIGEEVRFMQRQLSDRSKILGIKLNTGEKVMIVGEGKVNMSPASFNKINLKSDKYEINHSGFYNVGLQIPAGNFILSYSGNVEKEKPFVQVLSSKRNIIKTYDFTNKKAYEITLKENEILEVNKFLFYESESLIITLETK